MCVDDEWGAKSWVWWSGIAERMWWVIGWVLRTHNELAEHEGWMFADAAVGGLRYLI